MGFKEQTFYAVECDYPDCGTTYEDGEYAYWEDKGTALTQALERWGDISTDWHREEGGDRVFCAAHDRIWTADEESDLPDEEREDDLAVDLPDGTRVRLEL